MCPTYPQESGIVVSILHVSLKLWGINIRIPFTAKGMHVCAFSQLPFIIQTKLIININLFCLHLPRSRDSVVAIATGYGLDDRGVRVRVSLHVVQTGSGVHQTSYPMGTVASFLGSKTAGA
jgi:hypothetical protein